MTDKKQPAIMELVPIIHKYLGELFQELEPRLSGIESRIMTIELDMTDVKNRGLSYQGTWQRAASYGQGDCVTYDGSLWIALRETSGEKPSTDNSGFQLAVKRGKDGRQ